jgi:predicted RNA binding protein YcfA (HicA-like mRNA interferase family)
LAPELLEKPWQQVRQSASHAVQEIARMAASQAPELLEKPWQQVRQSASHAVQEIALRAASNGASKLHE